ncbi:MAG: tetratricopeptide repeat protein [Qingshengfaniella sp.]
MRLFFISILFIIVAGAAVIGWNAMEPADRRARDLYEDGLQRQAAGDLDKAALQFRDAARLDARFIEPRFAQALLLRQRSEFEAAAAKLIELLEIAPNYAPAHLEYAELLYIGGLQDRARIELDKAMTELHDTPRVLALGSALALSDGNVQDAATQARQAINAAPDLPGPYATLSAIALQDGRTRDALKILEDAHQAGAEDLSLAILRLALLRDLGNEHDIGVELERLTHRFSNQPRFAFALVDWYLQQDPPDTVQATATLRQLIMPNANNARLMADIVDSLIAVTGASGAKETLQDLAKTAETPHLFAREIAALEFAIGDETQAIERLSAAITAAPDTPSKTAARLLLARLLDPLDDAIARKEITNQILSEDPGNLPASMLRADTYLAEGETRLAIIDLRSALSTDPESLEIITRLATAHYLEGSTALALDRLSKASSLSGDAPDQALALAHLLTSLHNPTAAADALDRALRKTDDDPRLIALRARIALEAGDLPIADRMAQYLAKLPEQTDRAAEIRAAVLAQRGQTDAALSLLEQSWQAEPSPHNLRALGAGYLRLGRSDDALALAKTAGATNPDWPEPWLLAADAQLDMNDLDAVDATLTTVIVQWPATPEHAAALVRLRLSRGQIDDATTTLGTALERAPDDPQLLTLAGAAAEMRGDPETAIGHYDAAHKQAPWDRTITQALTTMLLDYRDDRDSHTRALAVAGPFEKSATPSEVGTYGWALFRTGDATGARSYLQSAAEQLPTDPTAQLRYALFLNSITDTNAPEHLIRAAELAKGTPYANGPLGQRVEALLKERDAAVLSTP